MADIELIKPRELPAITNAQPTDAVMLDNGVTVGKVTPEQLVNAGAPVASEAEALAGVSNTKRMTPLRVRQVLDNVNNPAVLRAQAWAESTTPPDPLLPDSKSAKTWASIAEQGTVMVQWSMIAEEGQAILGNDITTGEPIRAYGGVAQISVNGFGPITPEEYSVDSDGVVTLTAPLAEGDVVSGFTQPRLSNSEAQAVVQGVLQQTGADVAAAVDAAARAEANAALVKPQFDSAAALKADTAMTDATVPVGTSVWTPDGSYVRVSIGGDITTDGGLHFDAEFSTSSVIPVSAIPSYDSFTLQRQVDKIVSVATSNGGPYFGVSGISVPSTNVSMSSQVDMPWYAKISNPTGVSMLDASGRTDTGSMFRIYGSGTPGDSSRKVPGNWNPTLHGLYLYGNGVDGDLTAIDLGEESSGLDREDSGNGTISRMYIQRFNKGINVRTIDTYLLTLDAVKIDQCEYAVYCDSSITENSGERMTITNSGLAAGSYGLWLNAAGIEWNITNTSIDFCRTSAIRLGPNFNFASVNIAYSWIEGSNNDAAIASDRTGNAGAGIVNVSNTRFVLATSTLASGNMPSGGRPDGVANAFQPVFKGRMNLNLDDCYFGYPKHCHGAADGVFMCDDNVILKSASGINFNGWPQFISKRFIANANWNFTDSTAGDSFASTGIKCYTPDLTQSATVEIIGSSSWSPSGSGRSVRVTGVSGAGYATIETDAVPIRQGQLAMPMAAYNLSGTTSATINARVKLRYYGEHFQELPNVSSITTTGTRVVVTFAAPHELVVGSKISVWSTGNPLLDRNHRVSDVDNATTIRFPLPTGVSSAPTSMVVSMLFSNLISTTTDVGDNLVSMYTDTDYQGYTGNRDWWCRHRNTKYGSDPVPAGATSVSAVFEVNGLAVGESMLIGAMMLGVWDA